MNVDIVTISIEKETLKKLDDYIKKIGCGANRSGFINESVKYYLKIRGGINFL